MFCDTYFSMEQQGNDVLIRQYLMEIMEKNGDPVVLKNLITDWPAGNWTIDNLESVFENEQLCFRVGKTYYNGMIWFSFVSADAMFNWQYVRQGRGYAISAVCLSFVLSCVQD